MGPARISLESLTPRPGIREQNLPTSKTTPTTSPCATMPTRRRSPRELPLCVISDARAGDVDRRGCIVNLGGRRGDALDPISVRGICVASEGRIFCSAGAISAVLGTGREGAPFLLFLLRAHPYRAPAPGRHDEWPELCRRLSRSARQAPERPHRGLAARRRADCARDRRRRGSIRGRFLRVCRAPFASGSDPALSARCRAFPAASDACLSPVPVVVM